MLYHVSARGADGALAPAIRRGGVSVQERQNRVPENQKGDLETGLDRWISSSGDAGSAPPRGGRWRASTRVVRRFSA